MINTIISNNCAGAAIMHDLGMEFRTPTINLQILPEQYLKFCRNLSYYLTTELTQCSELTETHAEYLKTMYSYVPDFPMGLLNDVLVVFQHYDSFEEAKAKWDERRLRVDYNSIGFLFHARGPVYKDVAEEFLKLDISNKLCLTQDFSIPGSVSFEGEAFSAVNGKLLITQVYDFRSWVNKSKSPIVKLKLHSLYDHFPDRHPEEGEEYLEVYNDMKVKECTGPGNNIALLMEPKSVTFDTYDYVMEHANYFKAIFTHNSELLKLPQAHMLNWSGVWLTKDSPKTKGISLCTSAKDWCDLHKDRLRLADYFEKHGGVDVFRGYWIKDKDPSIIPEKYLEHYRYSIVIENDIDDYWFTEKILNCFSTKTVPIYIGARKISELFNSLGIIHVYDKADVSYVVDNICSAFDYAQRLPAINDNFERVKPYKENWKKRFFRQYEDLLEDILHGKRTDPNLYVVSPCDRRN